MKIGSTEWKRLITDGAASFDIHLKPRHVEQFSVHAAELLKWNRKINLTAITDPVEVAIKHFVDALAPANLIPSNTRLLDIGSGGGFPGIPLKILIPSLSVTLIDASRKKVNFLKHALRTLGLKGIQARHARVEGISIVDLEAAVEKEDTYDVVLSRAVTSLEKFIRMALPLLEGEGVLIALKGKAPEKEIDAVFKQMRKMKGKEERRVSLDLNTYVLPYLTSERSIVAVRVQKEKPT